LRVWSNESKIEMLLIIFFIVINNYANSIKKLTFSLGLIFIVDALNL